MSSHENISPMTSTAPGAGEAAQPAPAGLPVRACSGQVLLPDPEFRLSFTWQCSDDGREVSGTVFSVTTREKQPFKLSLSPTNHRKRLVFPVLAATVEVWLWHSKHPHEHSKHPHEVQLHAEAQGPGPSKRDPSWIAVWHVGHEEPGPPEPNWEHEALETFSYLVMRTPEPPCCEKRRERFIFRNDPPLPPPPAPTPPAADPPVSGAPEGVTPPPTQPDVPQAPAIPKEPLKPLLELYPQLWCLKGVQELDTITRQVEQVLGLPLLEYLSSPETRKLSDDVWKETEELAGSSSASERADSLIVALQVLAFLIRLQRKDAFLREEPGRRLALEAIVVLPASPPAEKEGPKQKAADDTAPGPIVPAEQGWARILGPGLLRSIRQQLKGYEPGEIAFTFNVMPREKRVLSERLRVRTEHAAQTGHRQADSSQHGTDNTTGSDVRNELENLVGSLKLARDFTNLKEIVEPNGLGVTINGSWTGSDDPTSQRTLDRKHEARRAVELATNQLEKRVFHERERRLVEEYEKASRAIHDNLGSDRRQVGIYRWLKKLYTMSVKERGERLVIEFLVPSPAEALPFILGAGEDVPEPPTSPNRLEPPLSSYRDVNATNYQVLAAYYRVRRISPPPPEAGGASPGEAESGAFEAWQIRTYDALLGGYRRQYEVWRECYWQWLCESPWSLRELERAALKYQCLQVLRGLDPQPPAEQPSALRFFDMAFEWAEMAYRFYPWEVGTKSAGPPFRWGGASKLKPCPDPLFLSFLQASSARVLVPVAPEYWRTIAFFFYFGHLPPWGQNEVPLPKALLPLAQVLLDGCGCEHKDKAGRETWTVAVPTSLLYLSDGSQLPDCR